MYVFYKSITPVLSQAAMAVWLAILRYMGEMQAPTPATNTAHAVSPVSRVLAAYNMY